MADFQKIVLDLQTNNQSVGLKVSKGTIDDSTLNSAVLNKAVVETKVEGKTTLEDTLNKIHQKINDIQFLVDSGDTLDSIIEVVTAYKEADDNLDQSITNLSTKLNTRVDTLTEETKRSIGNEATDRKTEDMLHNWRFNFQPSIVANVTIDAKMLIDGTVTVDKEFIGDAQGFINGVFFAASAVSTKDGYTYSVALPPTAELGMNVVVYGLAAVNNTFYPSLPVSPDADLKDVAPKLNA
jgi:hypothetical protein